MNRHWMMLALLLSLFACLGGQSLNDGHMFPGDEAWEDPVYDVLTHPQYDMGGMLGTILVDGVTNTQVRIRPEVALWKIGVGMDIDLLIDGKGKIRRKARSGNRFGLRASCFPQGIDCCLIH